MNDLPTSSAQPPHKPKKRNPDLKKETGKAKRPPSSRLGHFADSDNDDDKKNFKRQVFSAPRVSSALKKRPDAKKVDNSSVPSYVMGVQIHDELAERKASFCGWKDDPEALMVVDGLAEGQRFDDTDFSAVDFSGADLTGICFAGATLTDANFAGADLRGADFSGADLRGVNFESANLEGANLEGALFDGAYLKNAIIVNVKLAKKDLNELEKMQKLQLEAEQGTLDLRKVNLKYLDLRRIDLRGVDLTGIDLSGICLVGVNLTGCKIDQQYLDGSYAFRDAPNRRLTIHKGNFAGADFTTLTDMQERAEATEVLRKARVLREKQKVEQEQVVAEEERSKETALNLLKERRLQEEEIKQKIEVAQNEAVAERVRFVMKHRPPPKEELPASKYDFPKLYPVEEEVEEKQTITQIVAEVVKVSEQVSYHVKKTIQKIIPRRSRVCRMRQRSE